MIRVGVLGGGQLGRMLALAGVPLGMRFTFLDPNDQSPAGYVGNLIVGEYDDDAALERFIEMSDVVTYEFENVPAHAAEFIAARRPVWPSAAALAVARDRLSEKTFFQSHGIPTARFAAVDSLSDLQKAVQEIGLPGVLKTRQLGYDGKGQARIHSVDDLEDVWNALGDVPLIYEGFVEFQRELSIIAVRGVDGATAFYPLVENDHSEGILRLSTAPAPRVDDALQQVANDYASRVLNELGYVGVLAIELFDTPDGLLANEMAPRVHNSGHWTIEGSETSQFENHVRAVCGLPLGSTAMVGHAAMVNIIGTVPETADMLQVPHAHVHLYDKTSKSRRKIGHVTIRADDAETVRSSVTAMRRVLAAR
jgi:5-(carboxyamino)imidazole ribonucleotide synthase